MYYSLIKKARLLKNGEAPVCIRITVNGYRSGFSKNAIEKLTSCLQPVNIPKKTILIAPDKKIQMSILFRKVSPAPII